jgi:hypothetical protein
MRPPPRDASWSPTNSNHTTKCPPVRSRRNSTPLRENANHSYGRIPGCEITTSQGSHYENDRHNPVRVANPFSTEAGVSNYFRAFCRSCTSWALRRTQRTASRAHEGIGAQRCGGLANMSIRMPPETRQALDRLIKTAEGFSGQSRRITLTPTIRCTARDSRRW